MQIEYSNFRSHTGERAIPETCPPHIRTLIVERRASAAQKRGIVLPSVASQSNDETEAMLAAAMSL